MCSCHFRAVDIQEGVGVVVCWFWVVTAVNGMNFKAMRNQLCLKAICILFLYLATGSLFFRWYFLNTAKVYSMKKKKLSSLTIFDFDSYKPLKLMPWILPDLYLVSQYNITCIQVVKILSCEIFPSSVLTFMKHL